MSETWQQRWRLILSFVALLGAVLLFTTLREWLWYWATAAYRDGLWAKAIVESLPSLLASSDGAALALQAGAQGKIVWAGLTLVVLIFVLVVIAVSAWICVRAFRRFRLWAAIAVATLTGLALLPPILMPPYQAVICADTDAASCGFALTAGERFYVTPYSYLIFKQLYSPDFAAFFWQTMRTEWALFNPANLLLVLAVLALMVERRDARDETVRHLADQVSQYRVLLLANSALVTAVGLSTPAELGWLAQVVAAIDPNNPVPFGELQLGTTLFLGINNSLFLALLFLPLGGLLWLRARRLAKAANPEARVSDLESWEKDKGVAILAHGPLLQIGSIFAPLVIGGGVSLLKAAVFAG